jgi:hypothetical protein
MPRQVGFDDPMATKMQESFHQHLCGPATAYQRITKEQPFED